ncbi:TIGR02757 family protein [Marinilabiliaceae bacterium JC017]|nr:TIGR02757 family protein [Marinilabiliaceae bacterium JC017]
MRTDEIKLLLDQKVFEYNRSEFIVEDPISIPHLFSLKENIEISGFLAATLSWGRRDQILKSARKLMGLMDDNPYEFLVYGSESDWSRFNHFYYRTFQECDCLYFIFALKEIYKFGGGLESLFTKGYKKGGVKEALVFFRSRFFSFNPPERTLKHVSNVQKGASAKRLNMFLRWMVRKDNAGVDFGIWEDISPGDLYLPLDVHTGNVARNLGLLKRKQNDWKSVEEITSVLRSFDAKDPVKYDFALFGLGINENR